MPHPPRSTRRKLLRAALAAAVVVVVILLVGGLVLYRLIQSAPTWWAPVNPADPVAAQTARDVENNVTTLVHKARPPTAEPGQPEDGAWTIRLTEAEANAWLAARLPAWVANQTDEFTWPGDLSPPQIRLQDGKLAVGVTLGKSDRGEVLSTTLIPEIAQDGALWLRSGSFSLGRLGVPASWVLSRSAALFGRRSAEAGRTLEALAGKHPVAERPIVRLSDGRRVRLLKIVLQDGAVTITCRTEPAVR